jgi:hypothetical protein
MERGIRRDELNGLASVDSRCRGLKLNSLFREKNEREPCRAVALRHCGIFATYQRQPFKVIDQSQPCGGVWKVHAPKFAVLGIAPQPFALPLDPNLNYTFMVLSWLLDNISHRPETSTNI